MSCMPPKSFLDFFVPAQWTEFRFHAPIISTALLFSFPDPDDGGMVMVSGAGTKDSYG